MHTIWAALRGAAVVTFFWYFFNPWVGNAGITLVRGSGGPVSTARLTMSVGAVSGVVYDWVRRRGEVQQTAAAITSATDLGLAYTVMVERPAAPLKCFERWSSGKDGNTGGIGGVPVGVFDMTECIPSDKGDNFSSRTVVLLPAPELPEVTCTPRGVGGRLANAFGFGGMTFNPAAAAAENADILRQFGRAVWIDVPGHLGPLELVTDESRASETAGRQLFTPALMEALLNHPGWSFETGGGWLACWRGGKVRPAGERLVPQVVFEASPGEINCPD